MQLKTKLFHITDPTSNKINVEGQDIILALNGKKTETKLEAVFNQAYLEFDKGEIYGNSLLSYYNVNEDGSLEVEGSKIQFLNAETNEPVLVKKITRDNTCNDDETVSFELVQKFAEMFKISKPDEVFHNLRNEQKQIFIDERAGNNNKAAADKAAADKAAEETLKESIDSEYVHDKKSYKEEQFFYNGIGFKEYIDNPYHLFYAKSTEHEPCVLIRRGETWWEECQEATDMSENDKTALIQFTDGKTLKQITVDLSTGEIIISDAETAE